jgi:small subunit ribosomal protein S19
MAKKEFLFRGKTVDELKSLSLNEFADLLKSRERRKIKRGFTEEEKKLIKELEKKDSVKTHCRDAIILPLMVGKTIMVHNGKEFVQVNVTAEMLGHRLGEFALTRRRVQHHAPGVGATKSSQALSVR